MILVSLALTALSGQGPGALAGEERPSARRLPHGDPESGPIVAVEEPPPREETRARRDRLVDLLRQTLLPGRRAAFYLEGSVDDHEREFRQDSNFYYLTGMDVGSAAMAVLFDERSRIERVYLTPVDDGWERYLGDALESGGVDRESGLPDGDRIRAIETTGFRGAVGEDPNAVGEAGEALGDISAWLGRKGTIYLPEVTTRDGKADLQPGSMAAKLDERVRHLDIRSASFALRELRLIKSAVEIANIRRAVEITCRAQAEALEAVAPGVPEYRIEGIVEHAFIREGARYSAFPSIVGSGPNATVLHYYRNGRTMGSDEMVVLDIGAEYARYAADVTRSLPTSGVFTAEQRAVYDAVLKSQSEAMRLARPGSSITKINDRAREIMEEHGLGEAYWHNCCHFVGLDVHDVGGRDAALAPGMVLTVEPGAYLPEKGIGVRIEDTLLITGGGHEVLSDCAVKDPVEIERRMAAGPISRGAPASRQR